MAKQLKEIEIPLGAKDSELCGWEYTIPEGMEATIVENKIVVKKKESEDERVLKIIKETLKSYNGGVIFGSLNERDYAECLYWLKEQGEHKKFRDGIQVGDKVTRNRDGMLVNLSQLNRVAKKDENQCQTFTKKDVEDAYLKGICDAKHELEKQGEKGTIRNDRKIPLSAWNEEDEMMLECVLDKIGGLGTGEMCKEWLINLKDRYTWKPSELQMEYLSAAIEESNENPVLESLYKDLKKLKGE